MTRILAITALSALLWVPGALAELGPKYAGWADGPEGFLLTKDESKAWSKVADDAAAERFIELFWARRDPDLSGPRNETREEFERRVQQADASFATDRRRGALTDRGKVLILLGQPARGSRTEPGQTLRPIGGESGAGSIATEDIQTRAEVWEYRPDQLPVSVRGPRFTIGFYEEHLNKNDFVLDRSLEGATAILRALSKAPEAMIRHPDLTEVPASYRTAAAAAAPAHLDWLDRQAWPEGAALVAGAGVAPGAATRPLWVHVELPAGAPALEVLTGRVSGADGAALSIFETKAKPIAVDSGTVYHVAVQVPPGATTLELAGGAGAEPVFVRDVPLDVPPIPQGQVWLSQPWIGRSVAQEPGSKHGDPFNFGGWHLVPTAGRLKGSELPYFGFASVPGGAQPELTATVNLLRGDQRLAGPLELKLTPSKVAEGLWVYGDTLTLTNLPPGGGYRLELTVADKTSGTSARRDLELQVVQ